MHSSPDPLSDPMSDVLARLARPDAPPFALLHRPGTGPDVVQVLLGEVTGHGLLADLPLAPPGPGSPGDPAEVLAVVPFRQLVERGTDVLDDGAPLLALRVTGRRSAGVSQLLDALPDVPLEVVETGYDVPDAEYERIVGAVLADEIAAGEGSNVVVHRSLTGRVDGSAPAAALRTFGRLLRRERNAYWTFVVHLPAEPSADEPVDRTFVGASPERHVGVVDGEALMNPISGTLRHPAAGFADTESRVRAVLELLADPKEDDELAMVVDEELKMMAAVCPQGGRMIGPRLAEMAHLTHTEYLLAGNSDLDVREVLRTTLFAPTVTGSPLRNACRIIARHEGRGRGYYAGVLALLGHDGAGRQTLDAPILIRTAHLETRRPAAVPEGGAGDDVTFRVPAGATLVRGSRPADELAETRAKAAGVLDALLVDDADRPRDAVPPVDRVGPVADDPRVRAALAARNDRLAAFWRRPAGRLPAVAGTRPPVTVLNAEDDFTVMLAHLLRRAGHPVQELPWDDDDVLERCAAAALLLAGPGPGDPRDRTDPRIDLMHRVVRARLEAGTPLLGICLGHQVLALQLGLPVRRLPAPDQGVQRTIDLFGRPERVGFYNSFAARADTPEVAGVEVAGVEVAGVEVAQEGGRVHALRGPGLAGLQFHVESVLTVHGEQVLARAVGWTRGVRTVG